jgi:aminoglycoside phosphotransferase (APT) family kinase protein
VIHNDWRFDNVILDPQQPTQVIGYWIGKWQLGDPLMEAVPSPTGFKRMMMR